MKPAIDQKWNRGFARLFSPATINNLLKNGSSPFIHELLSVSGYSKTLKKQTTIEELFNNIYDYLASNYRCEYVYKNTIAKELLIKRHSLTNSTLLTELRVGSSKADVVILNGSSSIYEIKSEYDSTDRLEEQISSYKQVFDRINVVTSYNHLSKILSELDATIGVLLLNEHGEVEEVREATSQKVFVKPSTIFETLRRSEYSMILKKHYGSLPSLPNTKIFRAYQELFSTLEPEVAHDEMVCQLKKRNVLTSTAEMMNSVPECLYAYLFSSEYAMKRKGQLLEMLNIKCGDLMKAS